MSGSRSGIWDSTVDWISNLFGLNQNTQPNTQPNPIAKYYNALGNGFSTDALSLLKQQGQEYGNSSAYQNAPQTWSPMGSKKESPAGDDKESPWDALLKGFTSKPGDTLAALGGIWGTYDKYQMSKQQQQLAEEAFNLQKDNYLNNERRTESLYQNKMANMRSNSL
jgi:hypothetical protein